MASGKTVLGAGVALALWLSPAAGWAQGKSEIDPAKRDAAMRQLRWPTGVGGCLLQALPEDIRRDALSRALTGQSNTAEPLRVAVAKVSEGCTGRPYSGSDLPLVGIFISTFQKAAASLLLAQQFGVGQTTLDAAWRDAGADEKAGFYAAADEFLSVTSSVTKRTLDAAPLAKRAGMTTDRTADPLFVRYYLATAMIERAEPAFAKTAPK